MKIGVKTFDSQEFLKHFEKDVDFFEFQAIQTNEYSFLKNFSLPIVIHAEHNVFGINIADKSKENKNLKAINFAKKVADLVNSKKIIVHPGGLEPYDSPKNVIDFVEKIKDDRILIENLPINSPEQMEEILNATGAGFCFDVNHAIKYAKDYGKNEMNIIKKFLKLPIRHFHLGGQKFIQGKERAHISLKEFDYNWKDILSLYPKDAEITLEVTIGIKEVEKDVELIRGVIGELN